MTVTITPNGSTGKQFPRVNRIIRAGLALNTGLYRLLRGRGMRRMGILTTLGARTGQKRSLPLAVFEAGPDTWWIVASKGGAAQHPAWYLNLAKNPDHVELEVGGRRLKVRPDSLHGPERAEAWKSIVEQSPNFGGYEKATDREIPVVRLRPIT